MSVALMALAFRTSLSSTQKLVLLALCDAANDQGECYPSVNTLTNKCSLSERAIQGSLSSLEQAGYLSRELRPGRATVYWITPAEGGIRQLETHYTYRIDADDGSFYIGVRTCAGPAEGDRYMGSGESFKGRRGLRKTVLAEFGSRAEACAAEFAAISAAIESPLCLNRKIATNPRTSYAPQQVHPARRAPAPAAGAPPPPHDVHHTPARRAPRTIIEPSVESSLKRVSGAAQAQTPPSFAGDSNADEIQKNAKVVLASVFELPAQWGLDAESLGWKPTEIVKESEKFRQYFVSGKGDGTRRTLRGWRQGWSNWLNNAERYKR